MKMGAKEDGKGEGEIRENVHGRNEKGIRGKRRKWEEMRAKEGGREKGKTEKNVDGGSEKGIRSKGRKRKENGSKRRPKRERGKSRKTWMEEVRKACEERGENGRTQGKCAKQRKRGSHYGGEAQEAQLPTIPHLTVTSVLG